MPTSLSRFVTKVTVAAVCAGAFASHASPAVAQERAYFVTYDHYLEEPRNLEVAIANTTGVPKADAPVYTAPWLELEYGVTGWWTSELYLEGIAVTGDGTAFGGWRIENRFRPLRTEHRINPVLYFEYEDTNEASRIQKEIVGSGALDNEPLAVLRREHARELEWKLILSSAVHGWNLAENVVFEKNLSEDEGVEFGYSVGTSRALASLVSGRDCRLCRENFVAGVEVYGGLGSSDERTLAGTRHFVAPVLAWHATPRSTLKVSAGFGLTETSDRVLLRVGWSYETTTRRHK
jgi:hypothetical protein